MRKAMRAWNAFVVTLLMGMGLVLILFGAVPRVFSSEYLDAIYYGGIGILICDTALKVWRDRAAESDSV